MLKVIKLVCFLTLTTLLIGAVESVAQTLEYPALSTANVFTNSNQFTSGLYLGPQLFANLSSLAGFTNIVYLSDGTAGSNPCTGSGTGAFAIYLGGAWNCSFSGSIFGQTLAINGTGLTAGDTANFNSSTPAAPSNGLNVIWATSRSSTTDSISAAIVGDGNSSHCFLGTGIFGPCITTSSAQIGDTLRFNVNGDSAWDAANAAVKLLGISINASNTNNFDSWGTPACGCGNTFTSSSGAAPTATDGWGQYLQSVSTASTTTIGVHTAENGNNTQIGILSWYRFSSRFRIWQTTNARFWIGMGTWNINAGFAGNNNLQLDGSAGYAADIPNKNTLGFRYSSTTDTHWQAAAILAGSSPTSTFVDTGVTPDTAIHLFEMATNSTGTAVYYFIDHSLVATITTNLPAVPSGGTQTSANYDLTAAPFWTADNKNTANTVSATWFGVNLSLK